MSAGAAYAVEQIATQLVAQLRQVLFRQQTQLLGGVNYLPKLCDELRRYLLDSVSRSSGHFASGLGTVELTVALHYVYNTPFDQLIWDVGHQAYPDRPDGPRPR